MTGKRIRRWYVVYRTGDSEFTYLVSAFCTTAIYRWLKSSKRHYKIVPAKVWHLVKAMSGNCYWMELPSHLTLNHWPMRLDDWIYHVVILN